MEYFFILGRNPELSVAEIFSYLKKENVKVNFYCRVRNALLLDLDNEINVTKFSVELGGVTAIGRILIFGAFEKIIENIKKTEIYFDEKIKFSYSLLDFSDENQTNELISVIKEKFKREGLKAVCKLSKRKIKMQEGSSEIGSPSKLKSIDMVYFLFKNEKNYFGVIEKICDFKENEKRDMEKPVRREALAISPRLSKILVNLSQVKEKETLLDPFCGIGAVLQEALLQRINVIGVDIDKNVTEDARKNLLWLEKNYKINSSWKIINGKSEKIKFEKIDGVATEPSFGELLKKLPEKETAINIIKRFEGLMIDVLSNLKNFVKKNGRIAFTAPLIKTKKGRVFCDINKICRSTDLRQESIAKFPIKEFRENQIVEREFYVLVR